MDFQRDITQRILELEREIDRLKRSSAWEDWTPTVTQSVAVTITVNYARYFTNGKLVVVRAKLTCTSAGVANNAIVIGGAPAAIEAVNPTATTVIGHGIVVDQGTQLYLVEVVANGATDWRFFITGGGSFVGNVPNFALANTDIISFILTYER